MRLPLIVAVLVLTTSSSLVVSNLAQADDLSANRPPVALNDVATVPAGSSVDIDVLANDTDPDSDPLNIDAVTQPAAGSVVIVGSVVRYTAAATAGDVTFGYTASDGYRTADAQVTVHVTPVTDTAPSAQDDVASVMSGRLVRVDVTANDSDADGDVLTVSLLSTPSHGAVVVRNNDVVYQSMSGYVGDDQFDYQVDDGRGKTAQATVRITVTPLRVITIHAPHKVVALHRAVVVARVNQSAGQPAEVMIQRRSHGAWLTVKRGQLGADYRLRIEWRPNRPGTLRLRAVATWGEQPQVASAVVKTRVVARFEAVVRHVTRKDVRFTWHPGCPVGPSQLRMITMTHWDYHGRIQRGRLVGSVWAVRAYLNVFRTALRTHFPIKRMYPADRYHGKDKRAMAAGDTSAFNCRHVTGNPYRISQHSYGDAIDINTFENPYGTSSRVYPAAAAGRYFWNRGQHLGDPGVITSRSSIAKALWHQGWSWGARWSPPDYQHWSRNGG